MISSKGVSGYEQQANVTSPMADISRLLPTGGGSHSRIGGKVRLAAGLLFPPVLRPCSRCCSRPLVFGLSRAAHADGGGKDGTDSGSWMMEQRQALKLVLLVEDGVWPEYTLHEEGTWAAHRAHPDVECAPIAAAHLRPPSEREQS